MKRTYTLPLLYWTAAIIGLVLALLSEGWGDALGLTLLTAPLIGLVRVGVLSRRR